MPLCIFNKLGPIQFLEDNYNKLKPVLALNTSNVADMFDYILNGTCAGAMLSNLDIAFGLSAHADKTGKYCELEAIGPLLQNQFVSLQMSANISDQMLRVLDSLVSLSTATGQYSAQVRGA